jgi:hypothetical protein
MARHKAPTCQIRGAESGFWGSNIAQTMLLNNPATRTTPQFSDTLNSLKKIAAVLAFSLKIVDFIEFFTA